MKIELSPEDMLLDYVEQLLNRVEKPKIKYSSHFKKFPTNLEFSEEFLPRWQKMVEPAVKKFIVDTFSLQQFLLDCDGRVRKVNCTDSEFWQSVDMQFSHRGALRLYEQMLAEETEERPMYPVVLPADALLISIAVENFSHYSFAWLEKNAANWVIWALFVAWQYVTDKNVPWKTCFDRPAAVPLPVRGFLYQSACEWYSMVNHLIRRVSQKISVDRNYLFTGMQPIERRAALRFSGGASIGEIAEYGRAMANSIRAAHAHWTGPGTVALDDDRFLLGLFGSCGLEQQLIDFEAVLRDYNETRGLEDMVYESVIFN